MIRLFRQYNVQVAHPPIHPKRSIRNKRILNYLLLPGTLSLLFLGGKASAAPFTAGDIVISRVGTGSSALTNAATAIFLDEYTTTGQLVQSIALPTAANGANHAVTLTGTPAGGGLITEGALSLSNNGQYLTLGGYDATPGTNGPNNAGISTTDSATVNRVVARIDADGNVDTTTALSDAYSGNNIRSVSSIDGTQFYLGGNGSATTGGVRYTTLGSTSSTQLESALTNTRVTTVATGQLYTSTTQNPPGAGIYAVGTGLPTTGSQDVQLIASAGANSSPVDYLFADANTLFVADARTNGSGGLYRFTKAEGATAFTSAPSLFTLAGNVGLTSLTTSADGNSLFAISTDNRLVSFNAANNTFATVATAGANTAFRGVSLAPGVAAVPEMGFMASFGLGISMLGIRRLRARQRA